MALSSLQLSSLNCLWVPSSHFIPIINSVLYELSMYFKIGCMESPIILGKLLKCASIEVPIALRNNPQKEIVSDLITRKPGTLTYFFIALVLRVLKGTLGSFMLWDLH